MSSISKFFEKPFIYKLRNFFVSESTHPIKKKKSEEIEENSFGMVENPFELNENYGDSRQKNTKNDNLATVSIYENEYSDFVILEFGDARIISKEEWLDIFKKKNLQNISHKDLYVSLQKGITFLVFDIFF